MEPPSGPKTIPQACRNCKLPGHRIKACLELCISCEPSCGVKPSECPQYLAGANTGYVRQRKAPKAAAVQQPEHTRTKGVEQKCSECSEVFPSKTKLFKHLEVSHGVLGTSSIPFEKAILLVGWINGVDGEEYDESDVWKKDGNLNAEWNSQGADGKVLDLLVTAIASVDEIADLKDAIKTMSRSTSCAQRAAYSLGQEISASASCETFSVMVRKLLGVHHRQPPALRIDCETYTCVITNQSICHPIIYTIGRSSTEWVEAGQQS